MDKLHVVVRADLPAAPQGVQSMHAAIQFAMEHPEVGRRWFEESNFLAWLRAPDENALYRLIERAERFGVKYSAFREPDLGNCITAVAFEPGKPGRKVCSGLPLADPSLAA